MADFEKAFAKLRYWEGGKVSDSQDPGGRTNAGITQRTYDAWVKGWNKPDKDVWDLGEDEIKAFYLTEFWLPCRGKLIASQPLASLLFSMAVLQGKKPAVRRLQKILGVPQDGIMGTQSLTAIEKASAIALLKVYGQANIDFFRRLVESRPASEKFLNGWEARVRDYLT